MNICRKGFLRSASTASSPLAVSAAARLGFTEKFRNRLDLLLEQVRIVVVGFIGDTGEAHGHRRQRDLSLDFPQRCGVAFFFGAGSALVRSLRRCSGGLLVVLGRNSYRHAATIVPARTTTTLIDLLRHAASRLRLLCLAWH